MMILATQIEQGFYAIRQASIAGSSRYVSLAFTLASLFCIIKLVKFTYDLVSDEQHGGFGGISLKELLKPVLLLMLLMSSSMVVSVTDSVCNMITTGIISTIPSELGEDEYKAALKKIEQQNETQKQKENEEAAEELISQWKHKDFKNAITSAFEWLWHRFKMIFKETFMMYNVNTAGVVLPHMANWLCRIFSIIFSAVAEIYLSIYALFFPLAIAFSILDIWKDSLLSLATKYLQVSFWKVILAAIMWIVSYARIAVLSINFTGTESEMLGKQMAIIWAAGLVSLAGVFAITKIPSIAADIIKSASAAANDNTAGTITSLPAKGAKAAVGAAGK